MYRALVWFEVGPANACARSLYSVALVRLSVPIGGRLFVGWCTTNLLLLGMSGIVGFTFGTLNNRQTCASIHYKRPALTCPGTIDPIDSSMLTVLAPLFSVELPLIVSLYATRFLPFNFRCGVGPPSLLFLTLCSFLLSY